MRAVLYARYSSELQNARSIEDQLAQARAHAGREGWIVIGEYSDAALSGSSLHNRPGLAALLSAVQSGAADIVLTESLDRLSRDMEDLAHIHKRLSYLGVRIVTLADGAVGKMHIGLKGLIANLYLEDLAQKTRRGQAGRVKAGRIPGGRCYGYDVVKSDDHGQRVINDAEASIVRRVFAEYVAGASPIAIASRLNREGVKSPRGGLWNASTLNGSRKRLNGILSNTLYAGVMVYNRQRFIKDPATGKRQARINPESEWMTAELPALRIIDAATWDASQARRTHLGGAHLTHRRRPKRLLSGMLECGACGGSYILRSAGFVACSRHMNTGTCTNRRTVAMAEIETRVLAAIQKHLMAPEMVAAAMTAYRIERERLASEAAKAARTIDRDLSDIARSMARLLATIEAGADPAAMAPRINELDARRREVDARAKQPSPRIVAIHPNAPAHYAAKVAGLRAALTSGQTRADETIPMVRELIRNVRILPTPKGQPVGLEIVGDLAALMQPAPREAALSVSVVAGARNGRYGQRQASASEFLICG